MGAWCAVNCPFEKDSRPDRDDETDVIIRSTPPRGRQRHCSEGAPAASALDPSGSQGGRSARDSGAQQQQAGDMELCNVCKRKHGSETYCLDLRHIKMKRLRGGVWGNSEDAPQLIGPPPRSPAAPSPQDGDTGVCKVCKLKHDNLCLDLRHIKMKRLRGGVWGNSEDAPQLIGPPPPRGKDAAPATPDAAIRQVNSEGASQPRGQLPISERQAGSNRSKSEVASDPMIQSGLRPQQEIEVIFDDSGDMSSPRQAASHQVQPKPQQEQHLLRAAEQQGLQGQLSTGEELIGSKEEQPNSGEALPPSKEGQPVTGKAAARQEQREEAWPCKHPGYLEKCTAERKYSCACCLKRFSKASYLMRHLTVPSAEPPYGCSSRPGHLVSASTVEGKIKSHPKVKQLLCAFCRKGFSSSSNLKRHVRIHTGQKPFVCATCNKGFAQRYYLTEHMCAHTGEKPYNCVTCNRGFAASGDLIKHIRTHTGEKPYVCVTCKKSFAQRYYLTLHMRTHTGEKPFVCATCKKGFVASGDLTKHIRTHTGEKPYVCVTCKKSFAHRVSLTEHMRTHTGEEPFVCVTCKKGFAQHSNFNRHMRTHTGEKPFSCIICRKEFSQLFEVTMHVRKRHPERF